MEMIYQSFLSLSLRDFVVDVAKVSVWLNLWQEVTILISFHKPGAGFILIFGKLSGEWLVFLLILLKGLIWNLEKKCLG